MTVNHPDVRVTPTVTTIECRGAVIQLHLTDDDAHQIELPSYVPADVIPHLIECLYTAGNIIADRSKQ